MDKYLFDILVCPICGRQVVLKPETDEFICKLDKIAYPIRNGIPVMLIEEGRKINSIEASDEKI